ncbi:hypothetical protein GCM10011529_31060 [Polymorphobacter glacialis]|uniref:Cytochrome c oxidase assembly protein n=2 Tax=Sandarakinorhabdus glacialis TaxID=1614636 RepID=A0A917EDS9_9SPHN|nr:hypothetical protein GCM10011529_31060 [Polymorphobacter glacialis]
MPMIRGPMNRWTLGAIGAALLAQAWIGPLALWAKFAFAGHMAAHMTVVAIAAPFLALALDRPLDRAARVLPWAFSPILASTIEMVAVWGWHAPVAHAAAGRSPAVFAAEQASFLVAGIWLWGAALPRDRGRMAGGVVALLLTATHMTLLGVLILLSPRLLYGHAASLADQQTGGAIMLGVGGAAYLAGGLALLARLLDDRRAA